MAVELFSTTYWIGAFERRPDATYLQLMKRERKRVARIRRRKNGQRSWLRRTHD